MAALREFLLRVLWREMVAVFLPDATSGERTVKMIGMCKYILSAWYCLLTSI